MAQVDACQPEPQAAKKRNEGEDAGQHGIPLVQDYRIARAGSQPLRHRAVEIEGSACGQTALCLKLPDPHGSDAAPLRPDFKPPCSAVVVSGASKRYSPACAACTRSSPGMRAGRRADPTYDDVCSGDTGHAEVVRIQFDPAVLTFR